MSRVVRYRSVQGYVEWVVGRSVGLPSSGDQLILPLITQEQLDMVKEDPKPVAEEGNIEY
jgi:hypothetical protein